MFALLACFYYAYSCKEMSVLQCLKVVCQDMFFSRSQSTATVQSLIGQPATNSRRALEQALAPLARIPDEKTNLVGELVAMKVDEPFKSEFSSQVGKKQNTYF